MTLYEHIMLGIDGAMAAGLHRRYGWQIVAWSGVAAVLPDWDGFTLLLGANRYADGHRVWGHGLLVAGALAVVLGAVACRWDLFGRVGRVLGGRLGWLGQSEAFPSDPASSELGHAALCPRHPTSCPMPHSWSTLCVWATVGLAAAYSHLLTDMLYSYGRNLPVWDVPLLWPFSTRGFAYPAVPWGDPGTTLIFIAGMFAMARWRSQTQRIAAVTLALFVAHVAIRAAVGH